MRSCGETAQRSGDKTERAHDILPPRRPVLDAMFAPKTVALIGATERHGSVGRTIFENLLASDFGGAVFPVNPLHETVLGREAFARIGDVPAKIDLAVIVTPAATVPGVIAECADAGVPGAVIISAGFKECGDGGRELERQILANARRGGMRIVGPNCLGVMLPHAGLNATFAAGMARPGKRRLHLAERRALHGDARLEPARKRRLQRVRLGRLDARCRLGRSHLLARRRSAHEQHRHLHGVDRRRARLSLRRARGGAHQADHRHQSRPHRAGGARRGIAHRLAHRAATRCSTPRSGAWACCA